ncbi:MAG: hypothetical protein ACLU24_08820 [Candidatus Pseudoruminococcus sp.]
MSVRRKDSACRRKTHIGLFSYKPLYGVMPFNIPRATAQYIGESKV